MSRTMAPPPLPKLPAGMPPQGQWTYEDYCRIPGDGKRYEVIRGVLYVCPAPRTRHQYASGTLHVRLRNFVETRKLGLVFYSPVDVILPGLATPVQPDLLFVCHERLNIIGEKNILGAPDLLIDTLSPSNPSHDRITKFAVYAEAGVKEYWIVDLKAQTIEIFTLDGGEYRLQGRFGRGSTAPSRLLEGFAVLVDEVCARV